jgi:hypothetical protein
MQMVASIKAIGKIITSMEMDMKNFQTELFILEAMSKVNPRDMEHIPGKTDKHMRENGLMA